MPRRGRHQLFIRYIWLSVSIPDDLFPLCKLLSRALLCSPCLASADEQNDPHVAYLLLLVIPCRRRFTFFASDEKYARFSSSLSCSRAASACSRIGAFPSGAFTHDDAAECVFYVLLRKNATASRLWTSGCPDRGLRLRDISCDIRRCGIVSAHPCGPLVSRLTSARLSLKRNQLIVSPLYRCT